MNINWNNLSAKDIEALKQQLKQDGMNLGNVNGSNNAGSIFDQIRQEQAFEPQILIHRPGIDDQDPHILPHRPNETNPQEATTILPHIVEQISKEDLAELINQLKQRGELTETSKPQDSTVGKLIPPEILEKIKNMTPEDLAKIFEQNGKPEIKPADGGWRAGEELPSNIKPNWIAGGAFTPVFNPGPWGDGIINDVGLKGGGFKPLPNMHPFDKNDTSVNY